MLIAKVAAMQGCLEEFCRDVEAAYGNFNATGDTDGTINEDRFREDWADLLLTYKKAKFILSE